MKTQWSVASSAILLCCLGLVPRGLTASAQTRASARFDDWLSSSEALVAQRGPTFGSEASTGESAAPSSSSRSSSSPTSALLPLRESEQVRLDLVNCWAGPDCFLARRVLPAAALIEGRSLYFRNINSESVQLLEAIAIAQGELTGYQLNDEAIGLDLGTQLIRANRIGELEMSLVRSNMPPDRYNGSVYLTFRGNEERQMTLPLSINVRSGPLLPLLVLFLGIVIGRILKYQQERGEPQADQLEDVYTLERDIRAAQLAEVDEKRLLSMSKGVRKLVVREQLEEVPEQIDVIRARLYALDQLQDVEQQLAAGGFSTSLAMEARALVMKARRHVLQKQDAEAKQSLEQIQALLNEAEAEGPSADVGLSRSIERAQAAEDFAQEYAEPTKAVRRSRQVSNARRWLVAIAGVSEGVRAEANLWLMRPLLSLTLLLSLSAIGLGSLYVEKGKAFGAKPFADYFGLILWGLSADIASRSLSSLQGPLGALGAAGAAGARNTGSGTAGANGQAPAPARSARAQAAQGSGGGRSRERSDA